jgi:hypothetical protein
VRRRWRLVTVLAVAAVLSCGLAMALVTGGVTVTPPTATQMPFASPIVVGLLLACTMALPLGLATYLTIGSFRHADIAVITAGLSLIVTAMVSATLGGDFLWFSTISASFGTTIAAVAIRSAHFRHEPPAKRPGRARIRLSQ